MKTYEFTKRTSNEGKYMFNEYLLDDFPKDWLFNLDHDDDWRDWHEELDRMYEEVLDRASKVGCVGIWMPGNAFWYYVHVSSDHDGIRATCWDDMGPVGHQDVTSGKELAREIGWHSFTEYEMAA